MPMSVIPASEGDGVTLPISISVEDGLTITGLTTSAEGEADGGTGVTVGMGVCTGAAVGVGAASTGASL